MKIVMFTTAEICSKELTGGQKRFKELYIFLKSKHDVILYSSDDSSNMDQSSKHVQFKKVKATKNAFVSTNVLFYQENKETIKGIKAQKYDRLIVFDVTTAWLLCKAGIRDFDLLLRQDLIEYKNLSLKAAKTGKIKRALYLSLMWLSESKCVRYARKIVVQCKYDGDRLINRHPCIKKNLMKKLSIQINNVNPSWIIENALQSDSLLQINSDTFQIAFIGNVDDYRKGFDLLEKYLLSHSAANDICAVVIGGGKKLAEFKKKFENNPGIIFTGHVNNPMMYIKGCNLLTVPSRADSCPNTVVEALYSEVPVIGSDAGGIPELIQDPQAIFELNPESLSNKIDELRTDNELYMRLKKNQLKRKEELTFDWAERIAEILEIK